MLTIRTCERQRGVLRVLGAALIAVCLTACSGTMAFSDTSSIAIEGNSPAPPEPKVEAPPPPKRVEVTQDKIVINEKIQFDYNKATIKPESHGLLDEIVSVIKENGHIKKISIEGHTDSDGTVNYNIKLSDDRAKSVMKYLTDHGIEAGRLTARGLGEIKPIAGNDSEEGKEKNRRVEFLITEQEQVTKTFEIDAKTGQRKEVDSAEAGGQGATAKKEKGK